MRREPLTSNTLITLIREAILGKIKLFWGGEVRVLQSYQPTQQGAAADAAIFLHRISEVAMGTTGQYAKKDVSDGIVTDYDQILISTYQASCVYEHDYTDSEAKTAVDLAKSLTRVMRHPDFNQRLIEKGLSIAGVGAIKIIDTSTDAAGFEKRPIFEFKIQHTDSYQLEVQSTSTVKQKIKGF